MATLSELDYFGTSWRSPQTRFFILHQFLCLYSVNLLESKYTFKAHKETMDKCTTQEEHREDTDNMLWKALRNNA